MVHVSRHVAGGSCELTGRRFSASYAGYLLASRLAPLLPRGLAYRLADVLGDLSWLLNRRARRAVRENLSHVLGDSPPPRVVRQVFRHGTRNYYDTFIIPRLTRAELLELVVVDGWKNLDEALERGNGAIIVGVHLSSVALAGQVIAAKGYPITSVVERVEPAKLMELLTRLRSGGGVKVLSLGPDLLRQLLVALRRNEVIGLVMDRDVAGTGVPVEFFGTETSLPGGAALLALRTGAPILPALAVRTPNGRFSGRIDPPVQLEQAANLQVSIRRATRRIAERFEQHIGAHPEQWTVYQSVWRDVGQAASGHRSA